MRTRDELLAWARTTIDHKSAPPHELLGVSATANAEQVQAAFHAIARTAHPDLHRQTLAPADCALLGSAYAAVAAAYQNLRSRPPAEPAEPLAAGSTRVGPHAASAASAVAQTARPLATTAAQTGEPAAASTDAPTAGAARPTPPMNAKAVLYYRKAELALRRGDLKGAVLQLKLACATDPSSTFLRAALAEVETEVRGAP